RGIERRVENARLALDLIRTWKTTELRIADQPGSAMTRHIKFRHDANPAGGSVSNNFPGLILGVIESIGAHLMQLRKFLALDAKALVFSQVPVKDVKFDCGHSVDVSLEHFYRFEVPPDID